MPAEIKESIRGKIDALKKAVETSDKGKMDAAAAELSSEIQKIGEFMYGKNKGENKDIPPEASTEQK